MRNIILSLVFAITAIVVQAQEPVITMTTSQPNGSEVEFYLTSFGDNTLVMVDWGDGRLEDFRIGQSNTTISGVTIGDAIKIYGPGITGLYASNLSLTSLDIFEAISLTSLTVSNNQLQSLDISGNTNLQYLDCSRNQLETLSLTTNIKLERISCFSNKLTTIDITSNAALWKLDCSNNLMTTLNFSAITKNVDIDCSNNLLTSLTLGKNMSSVRCKNNALTNLDVSQNTSLFLLDCSNNQINSLNLSNNANLQYLICSNNKLSSLDLSHNSSLTEVYCDNNKLTLATLPIKQTYWNVYSYNPQAIYSLPKKTYETGESIDLSSQLSVNGVNSVYTWKTKGGQTLSAGTHFTATNGVFVFNSVPTDSVYCEITNTDLTDITLTTKAIMVTEPVSYVVMTTATAVGSTFSFDMETTANSTPIQIDWGNGSLENYTIGTSLTPVSGILAGSTIKIYGLGIVGLNLSEKQLTALDITKNAAMTYLDCRNNQLTALDVTKNTALTHLVCYGNQLTALDLSNNTALTSLDCRFNKLTALDVSKNIELTNLSCSFNQLTIVGVTNNPALIYLNCSQNQLTALDVTNNPALEKLECHYNQLTFSTLPIQHPSWTDYTYSPQKKFSLSKKEFALNEEIDLSSQLTAGDNTTTYVWKTIDGVALIKDVDYTENNGKFIFLKQLRDFFYCEMSNETFPELTLVTENIFITQAVPSITMTTTTAVGNTFSFDIRATANKTPIKIDWGNGSLESYTIGTTSTTMSGTLAGSTIKIYGLGIVRLDLSEKQLTALDVTNNSTLTYLDCNNNQLTALDVSNNTALSNLFCRSNQLTALDVTSYTALIRLDCSYNQLTALDVTNNTALTRLDCSNNQLTALDVTNNTSLTEFLCYSNQLTALDVTSNIALTFLNCSSNQLTALDVSNNTALTSLSCRSNQLTTLDVTSNTALTGLDCSSNQLTALDVTSNVALTSLDCSSNQLTSLDVTSNIALTSLDCRSNQLTALDVTSNIALTSLDCDNNQLTALDVTSNIALTSLDCDNNQLTALDVTSNIALTSLDCDNNQLTVLDVTSNIALTRLDCYKNQLTALNLTNNTALTVLRCYENLLTFSTLPVQHPNWTDYTYSSQGKLPLSKNEFALNEEIDLSSQLTAGGNTTTYLWKTIGGVTLIKDVDYTESNGKFTFIKQPGDYFFCEMSNATFPGLTLATEVVSIAQTELSITMTTAATAGSTFSFNISATDNNTPIKIDWGNGSLANYTIGFSPTTVSGTLTGNTIKIYGVGIDGLKLSNNQLTELDVSNNPALNNLDCSNNQLTALDITNNTALNSLNCSYNQLTALDVSNNTALVDLYCYSNQLTELDVSNNTALTTLGCSLNQLTSLDASNNTALVNFYCSNNQLTSLNVSNATALNNLNCSNNQLTSLNVPNATALNNLNCSNNQLTSLNVPNATALNSLDCSNNRLTSLNVSNATALNSLNCSNNQLTALDVSNSAQLEWLNCSSNQLTSLYVSNSSALKELECDYNQLTFSALPVRQSSWTAYIYSHQENVSLSKNEFTVNEEIDLSSQLTAGGNTTTYLWKTIGGVTLIKDVDYTESNGKFTFIKQPGHYFYCEMSNATFPDLILATEVVSIAQTEPSITMTTAAAVGNTFSFDIRAIAYETPIQVDWGNGSLVNYTIGYGYSSVSGTLTGNTIKIYGVGIDGLELSNNQLTALDVSNNTALTSLDCRFNQLTNVDVTNNPALNYLDCSYNQLTALDVTNNPALEKLVCDYNLLTFSTLPVQHPSWTDYTYSPQKKFSLSKNEFALHEEIDLSGQLTAGGNTTTYVWKTIDGVTLIKDVDYTESKGKFTFIKQPGHYFYCEMRNATFPELTLATENIFITQTAPSITMTTTATTGSTFSFSISATANNTLIKIDRGNGSLESYTVGTSSTTVSGTLAGSTIKIYGVGIFYLNLSGNQLTELDVSNNTALTTLNCSFNQLTSLDASNNTALVNFYCSNNQLTSLNVSNATALNNLDCSSNQLTALDLSNNTALTNLNCSYNQLTTVDVSKNTALTSLDCRFNQLTTVDVSKNTALTNLNCRYNQLTTVDVSKNTALTYLICSDNQLTALDLSNNMTNLDCSYNQLTTVDVSKNTALTYLICSSNRLTVLDVTNNTALTYLDFRNNRLTVLDVTNNTALTNLDCSYNQLTTVDVTNNTALTYLNCDNNQLTTLDVTNNSMLTYLDCYDNQLTALDVTSNPALEKLDCDYNQLTALDVTNNTALKELSCFNNQLTFSTLPIQHPSWTDYTYSPQRKLPLSKNEFALNEEIDLSSQLTAGGNTTTYLWKTKGGVMLIKDVDYTESNGKFTFLKQPGDYFYCEMSNATFPELTLATENVFITQTEPSITMTTTTAIGGTFSFTISATTYNTPIKVDWGNGSLVSYTIGWHSTVSGKLTGSTIKIYGVGISYLRISGELTALDVTNNIALTELDCSSNQLTALDVTNNTALYNLDCSSNQIIALDVTNNVALTKLACNKNQLTALDVTNNTALKLLSCVNNQLTFSALPVPNASWTTYRYSPQEKVSLAKTDYELNEEIDLSSQLTAGGNTTTYLWKTIGGVTLIKDVDYTESNGKFTFIKQPGDYFFCEMSNATFPELTLATENIFIIPDQPSITMTTAVTVGSDFYFFLSTVARNVPIKIDWGNGILTNHTVNSDPFVSGTLAGNTIKIYGLGIKLFSLSNKKLTFLDVSNNTELTTVFCGDNQLTELNVSNTPALTSLDCYNNQLTSLDVSSSPALTSLNCRDNYLTFSSLPIKRSSWVVYNYPPQRAVKLPKKQYALTEAVDLSSELNVNGNTTNYTWKTKGGATLVAGIDYNVVGGVTTFLRVQTDSVYCQMTNATFPYLGLNTINIKVSAYPLSVEDNEVAISVYPNPATENFTIKMTEEIVRVEVYSITGVRVFENGQYSSPTVTVPLTNMPKGALLIKAYTRNGVYSSKVVKI